MGLILRSSSLANSGNTVSIKGSALTYNEGDGNFVYLLTNMSGSRISLTGSVSVNGSITGSFSGSLANLTGTATHVPYFSSAQVLADSAMFQVDNGGGSYSIALNQNGVSGVAPEALFVYQLSSTSYNVISGKGNLNNYLQLNIQNENNGANASSDVVATANNGNESANYIDMGINGASFAGTIGVANDAYVYATGSNFHIGNINPNTYLGLFAGGTDVVVNNKLRLNPSNQHIMSGSLNISGSLIATGAATSITGSLFGTSSFATVAQTASSADNFNVRNTLTATTIIVQTITSSVSYLTGSTRFGSNVTNNTHTFTGSVLITGSLTATGSVGIFGNTNITSGSLTVSGQTNTTIHTISGLISIGGANLDPASYGADLSFVTGSSRVWIGWNRAGAPGEIDFISNRGTGTQGGFNFYDYSSSLTPMLILRPGSITVTGSFIVTSGSLTDFQVTDTGTKQGNAVTDTHTITGSISISGSSHTTIGNLALTGSQSSSGSITVDSGSIRVASGSVTTPKVLGNTAPPTMTAGTGAGTSPTISISGSDVAGIIRIAAGTGPSAKADIVNITFTSAYTTPPYVLLTPASYSSSLSFGGISGAFTTASTTGFTIFSSEGSLRGATAYSWSYHVVG